MATAIVRDLVPGVRPPVRRRRRRRLVWHLPEWGWALMGGMFAGTILVGILLLPAPWWGIPAAVSIGPAVIMDLVDRKRGAGSADDLR